MSFTNEVSFVRGWRHESGDWLMELRVFTGALWWKRSELRLARGSGGLWNWYPEGDRCPTWMALWLHDRTKQLEWNREPAPVPPAEVKP